MAVIIPGKYVFIATPLTASVATAMYLVSIPEAVNCVDKRKGITHFATWPEIKQEYAEYLTGTEITFTTVRNPYDIAVSWYIRNVTRFHKKFPTKVAGDPGFLGFLERWTSRDHAPYIVKGSMFSQAKGIRQILRYERLQMDLSTIVRRIPGAVPKAKFHVANASPDKQHWSLYYDVKTFDYINRQFRNDIANFGYQFIWE